MTATARRAQRQRSYSAAYRASHKAQEAERARRYAAKRLGEAQQCSRLFCANRTRHESGLCWRHRKEQG